MPTSLDVNILRAPVASPTWARPGDGDVIERVRHPSSPVDSFEDAPASPRCALGGSTTVGEPVDGVASVAGDGSAPHDHAVIGEAPSTSLVGAGVRATGAANVVGEDYVAPAMRVRIDDALATMLDRSPDELNRLGESPILLAKCDDIARRIIRDGGKTSVAALAREVGSAAVTVKRLLDSSLFRRVYDEVSDEVLGTIDDRIANERLDIGMRQDALQRRAMTALNTCFEIVARHKAATEAGANVRPGVLKLAIDAAAEVRQIGSARSGAASGATNVTNINITRNQATIIGGAIRESGVDLSDVIGEFLAPVAAGDDQQEKAS